MILGKIAEIDEAVAAGITEWADPDGDGDRIYDAEDYADFDTLRSIIVRHLAKTETIHELRTLRYRVKQLGKQAGKQGDRIYQLRCALTEARSHYVTSDATFIRGLRDQVREQQVEIADLKLERRQVSSTVDVLRGRVIAAEGKLEAAQDDLEAVQRANQALLERALKAERELDRSRNERDTANVNAASDGLAKAYGC